ncbi:MAG TPA: hypothetical protein DEQ04_08375 [Thermovirga lienii]|nr:hypothetical protein [Thermovirga lienii]
MKVKLLKLIVEGLSHLVWPVECPFCKRLGVVACDGCLDSALNGRGTSCLKCMGQYPCPVHSDNALPIYWGAIHEGKAREVVHLLKYGRIRSLGIKMGLALARNLPIEGPVGALVPVPLHKGSVRPFNQASEIAKGLGQALGVPVLDVLSWREELSCQVGKSFMERRMLPEDAIVLKDDAEFPEGKGIIIVDDVCTTGTTIERCKKALEKKGSHVVGSGVWSLGGSGK